MKQFNSIQITILKLLASSSGMLDTYTLFKRSRVDFSNFSRSFNKLISEGIVIENNNYVSITSRKSSFVRSAFLNAATGEKAWRKIPDQMIGHSINVNSPYIPSRSLLDKKAFINDKN